MAVFVGVEVVVGVVDIVAVGMGVFVRIIFWVGVVDGVNIRVAVGVGVSEDATGQPEQAVRKMAQNNTNAGLFVSLDRPFR